MSKRRRPKHQPERPRQWTRPPLPPAPPPSSAAEVSDHALVRYLERVIGIDVEALRQQLLGNGRKDLIHTMRNGRLHLAGNVTLIIRDCRVVSVVPTDDVSVGARVRHDGS